MLKLLSPIPVLYPEIHERYQVINPFITIIGSLFIIYHPPLYMGVPVLPSDTGR